jgi:hypothetical protein
MKVKAIIFLFVIYVGLQSGSIFASEKSWRDWIPERVRRFVGTSAVAVGAGLIPMMGAAASEVTLEPWMIERIKFGGLLCVGGGILVGILDQIFPELINGKEKEDPFIAPGARLIGELLSDRLAYPTYLTKIHALLKRNDFDTPLIACYKEIYSAVEADDILRQQCALAMKQVVLERGNEIEITKDEVQNIRKNTTTQEEVDTEVNKLREAKIKQQQGPVNTMIANLESKLKQQFSLKEKSAQLNRIMTPEQKAAVSVALRLKNQELIEIKYPGTFEKTSSQKFYTPIEYSEAKAIRKRSAMSPNEWYQHRVGATKW